MQEKQYYSVRMRASKNGSHEQGGKHISGGELLSTFNDLPKAVMGLLEKGLFHSRGEPDFMQIQFECVEEPVLFTEPLPVTTHDVEDRTKGQMLAQELLKEAGVPQKTIEKAYERIAENPDVNGAMLIHSHTGKRLDKRSGKGIRVSRMDWLEGNFKKWANASNLSYSLRVKEAITLATKVSRHPATLAELCWSDDPDYITGYVASKKLGYQRITKLKEHGDERGCRIFFVDSLENTADYIKYLEKQPVFVQWEEKDDAGFN